MNINEIELRQKEYKKLQYQLKKDYEMLFEACIEDQHLFDELPVGLKRAIGSRYKEYNGD